AAMPGSTAAMRPAASATSRTASIPPAGSMTRPPLISNSYLPARMSGIRASRPAPAAAAPRNSRRVIMGRHLHWFHGRNILLQWWPPQIGVSNKSHTSWHWFCSLHGRREVFGQNRGADDGTATPAPDPRQDQPGKKGELQ